MAINFEEQFQKLKQIIEKVDKFYFEVDKEYIGPVNPSSIITFGSEVFKINVLVLSESVPSFYLPVSFDSDHFEAVTVHLDDRFEFRYYSPFSKELRELNVLVGDSEYSYDGTVKGATEFFKSKNWTFDILYKIDILQ